MDYSHPESLEHSPEPRRLGDLPLLMRKRERSCLFLLLLLSFSSPTLRIFSPLRQTAGGAGKNPGLEVKSLGFLSCQLHAM